MHGKLTFRISSGFSLNFSGSEQLHSSDAVLTHFGKSFASTAGMASFRFAICITILLSLVSGLVNPLLAQNLKTAEFQEGATKGFDHVYSLDYDEARGAFQNLRQQYPQPPGPPLYLALTLWQHELFRRQDLGVDRFVSPESFLQAGGRQMPAEERNAFFRYIGDSQAACRAILKEKPGARCAREII